MHIRKGSIEIILVSPVRSIYRKLILENLSIRKVAHSLGEEHLDLFISHGFGLVSIIA
jgi:hypothetical protein